MFKNNSSENEIYSSMERTIVANQVEQNYGFNKLARAADYLNAAAVIFENAGMHSEASEVMVILRDLAEELK